MKYLVVFYQGCYRKVDYRTDNYEQACEVKHELENEMYMCGERNFCYVIEEVK